MPCRASVRILPAGFIQDLESRTRKELKSRLKEFHLQIKGDCLSLKFKFRDNLREFRVVVDPQLFGFWWGIPRNKMEQELRKMIASVLSSADRGYHHD